MNNSLFITIITGIVVFVVSQYFLKLVLEPIIEVRKTIIGVSNTLLYHQAKILAANPDADNEISLSLRKLSAELRSNVSLIPFYKALSACSALPKTDNILDACRELNLLSSNMNNLNPDIKDDNKKGRRCRENLNAINKIGQLLNVKTSYEDKPMNIKSDNVANTSEGLLASQQDELGLGDTENTMKDLEIPTGGRHVTYEAKRDSK